MQIDIVSLNKLWSPPDNLDVVVVIDVLRSFTTAAVAVRNGARSILLAEGPAAAFAARQRHPQAVLIGALGGGRPVPGFDYLNSPSQISGIDFSDRTVILSTVAGVRGVHRLATTPTVLATSLCTASATTRTIVAASPRRVALIVTGEWVDRDGDEDIACAELIRAQLEHRSIDPESVRERIRQSDFGRQFGAVQSPHLPIADLDHCTALDSDDFSLTLRRSVDSGELELVAERPTGASPRRQRRCPPSR